MVDRCANPECGKPMLYLRDGTIYCFEEIDSGDGFGNRLKHYWFCGNCSVNHLQGIPSEFGPQNTLSKFWGSFDRSSGRTRSLPEQFHRSADSGRRSTGLTLKAKG